MAYMNTIVILCYRTVLLYNMEFVYKYWCILGGVPAFNAGGNNWDHQSWLQREGIGKDLMKHVELNFTLQSCESAIAFLWVIVAIMARYPSCHHQWFSWSFIKDLWVASPGTVIIKS